MCTIIHIYKYTYTDTIRDTHAVASAFRADQINETHVYAFVATQ